MFHSLQNDEVIKFDQFCRVDTNFNKPFKIMIDHKLLLATKFSFILYFATKILACHVFIVFKMIRSSNSIMFDS